MYDPDSIDEFLRRLQPRIQGAAAGADPSPEALRDLLVDTVEALQVTVEELRVTNEELSAQSEEIDSARRQRDAEGARWRLLFEAVPDAVLVTDGDGMVREANPAAGEMLGVRHPDLRGKPLAVYVAEDSRRAFRRWLHELRETSGPRRWELRMKPRGRLPIQVEVAVAPLSPGIVGSDFAWSLRDVTEYAEAEAQRDEAVGTLRAMVAALPAAAAAMDLDATVLVWNDAARRLLGWSEEEVVGLPNPAVAEELDALLDAARAALPGAGPVRAEVLARRRDGTTLPLRVCVAAMADAGGEVRGTVAVMEPGGDEAERPGARGAEERRGWSPAEAERVLLGGAGEAGFAERLRTGVAAGLHFGRLRAGDRLPSIREAARSAGTDHRVVSAAYQRLSSEGLVEVRNRRGASIAPLPASDGPELGESAGWLAGALAGAAALQLRVPQLADLVRRWTTAAVVRCACVESVEDERAALCHEVEHQWGMKTFPVAAGEGDAHGRRALADALREADLVLTTAFHAHAVAPVAAALGKPLVVAAANPEVVEAVEERLRAGTLTAVVDDPAYGERLRAVEGGERLRVVRAADAEAVAALDPAEPVLVTWAAHRRLQRPLRMLVPPSRFVSSDTAEAIARVLVRVNVEASRRGA